MMLTFNYLISFLLMVLVVAGHHTDDEISIPSSGLIYSAGSQLEISAGTTVILNGMLIIEAGARIVAKGTSAAPIIFQGSGSSNGVLILGGSGDNSDTSEFTDIASGSTGVPSYKNTYGGTNQPSSLMTYCKFMNVGSSSLDINSLTLIGLDDSHIIDHIYVEDSQDDGIEVFNGTVNLNYIHVVDAVDEFFDVDDGWAGKITSLTVQVTSSSSSKQSLLEIGSGATTIATMTNVHFISPSGNSETGTITAFYTTNQKAINIRDSTSSVTLNQATVLTGSSASTNKLPLQISNAGPYIYNATTFGKTSLTVSSSGLVLSAGSQLILAAGATVTLQGMLIFEAGSRLIARGTSSNPIQFVGSGTSSGVLILGGAGDSSDSSIFSDIPSNKNGVPSYNTAYGGSMQPANAISYCRFISIGSNGFDINALTLVGVNSDSIIEYVQVVDSQDDGIEVFNGTVNLNHIHVIDAVDDYLDVDDGWSGTITDLTIEITSSTTSTNSLIEVGSGATTYATLTNVHFIDSDGVDRVGGITSYYTTTAKSINIRDATSELTLNQRPTVRGSGNSSSVLPLQISADGPFTFSGTVFGVNSLTIPVSGRVVSAGSQLVIQPGVEVFVNGMLIIEAGARIIARGTADSPIKFIGSGDAAGVIILGGSGDESDTSTFNDIPSNTNNIPSYTTTYGGSYQPISVLTYCTFDDIGSNANDVNSLTLVGLDSSHDIHDLFVTNSLDDGMEIFDGTVNLYNVQITDAVDDFFDVDDGWRGTITNLTVEITSTSSTINSLIEVGSGATTAATAINVHFIDSSGTSQVGDVTAYYSTSQKAINIRDSSSSIILNQQETLVGSSDSTDLLPLQISNAGPYAFTTETSFGLTSLTVPSSGKVVSAGNQLILAAGCTVTLNGMLIIEAGAKIVAIGTSTNPIVFIGSGSFSGVLILGGAGDSTDTKAFTDIPANTHGVPSYTTKYGGSNQAANALEYCEFVSIGSNDYDINALTLVGLDDSHTINHLQITESQDDGIEIFDGSVSVSNIQITDAVDDFFDCDDGWTGTATSITVETKNDVLNINSLIEVGSAATTTATMINVHYIDSDGEDQTGDLTQYFTTSTNVINIRDASVLHLNQRKTYIGSTQSTNILPVGKSTAGAYSFANSITTNAPTPSPSVRPTPFPTGSPVKNHGSSDDSNKLSAGIIALIIILIVLFFIALAAAIYFYNTRNYNRAEKLDDHEIVGVQKV